jgi:hypothetical protein
VSSLKLTCSACADADDLRHAHQPTRQPLPVFMFTF